jgi:hypothetical protein
VRHRCHGIVFTLLANVALAAMPAAAQAPTRNAALRYWNAFALMQDSAVTPETSALLGNVVDGRAEWDEARLGPIVDANAEALETMRRATTLADCDWGYDYELGPRAPIGHVARARALARLNTLAGMRLAQQGKTSEAVEVWLAGIRFSRHLAAGGPLVATLVAATTFGTAADALTRAIRSGKVDAAGRRTIAAAINGFPRNVFDWAVPIRIEQQFVERLLDDLTQHPERLEFYRREINGSRSTERLVLPSANARAAYRQYMTRYVEALGQDPIMIPSPASLDPFFQAVVPAGKRIVDAHFAVSEQRDALQAALVAAER